MFEGFLEIAASYGIWAAMFLGLLIYLLQDSRRREIKYQQMVDKLTERLGVVNEIQKEVKALGEDVRRERPLRRKSDEKIKKEKLLDKSSGGGNLAPTATWGQG